ncbi:GNAT family N-acetyltransferase [Haloarchaeobius iranensis]|uniref:Acetyltransferase (GNAT) family protein n=1 Tax=Haloarchaeobius iranensis TaxID=996166 RepID=A0A1G9TPY1_9EURY|nr:GNAT family N-acetyltransferase [Haloarchaeobius iranensis]SDM49598.1 Acetyltransferase (GNAT) family protein [Haloarchaeobius iranensis]
MDDFVIRRFEASDTDAVWRVHDRALRASAMDYDPAYDRYLRHVEREFFETGGRFTVVEAADRGTVATTRDHAAEPAIVAIGGFQPLAYVREESDPPSWLPAAVDETCRIRSVAVAPDLQGEGIGTELLDRLATWAAERGFGYAVLKTDTSMAQACRFYERRGYESVAEREGERWYGKRLD